MNDEKQSINQVLVGKIVEASTQSSVKFCQACQTGILFWGGQPKVYSEEKQIDNLPPYFPARQRVRAMYSEGLASLNVLREIEVQKAEELGIIDRMSHQIRTQWTVEKLAKIIRECYSNGLLTSDLVVRTEKALEISPGKFRRPF